MNRVLFAAVAIAGLAPGAFAQEDRFAPVDRAIEAAVARKELPGAVVVVVHEDRVVHRQAFGKRALFPQPTLMTEDTVFDAASLTKPIATALALMLLIQDGKLSADDRLSKHLPSFARKETAEITLAHLLAHVSGLAAGNALADYRDGPAKAWERLLALSPTGPVGGTFRYSDLNYILLGKVVEQVAGEPLDTFVRRRLYEPLGMRDTGFRPGDALKARTAPTEKRDGRWLVGEVHDPRAALLGGVAGHAGLFTTADDLAILARMLLNDGRHAGQPFLRAETVRLMTTPREVIGPKAKGLRTYGWDMDTAYSSNRGAGFAKGVSYGHTGFTGTSLWIDPPTKCAVILLANRVHPDGKGNATPIRAQVATLVAEILGKR